MHQLEQMAKVLFRSSLFVRGILQSRAAGIAALRLEELSWAETKPLVAKLGLSTFLVKRNIQQRNHPLLAHGTVPTGEKNQMTRNLVSTNGGRQC